MPRLVDTEKFLDDDMAMFAALVEFIKANEIRCYTSLIRNLERYGLFRLLDYTYSHAEILDAYFDKWSRNCEGCEIGTGWPDGMGPLMG